MKIPVTTAMTSQAGTTAANAKAMNTAVTPSNTAIPGVCTPQSKKVLASGSAVVKSAGGTGSVQSRAPAGALDNKQPVGRPKLSASPKQTYGLKILHHNFQIGKLL
jgi:hypothetical protein